MSTEREQVEQEIAEELGWLRNRGGGFTRSENGDIAWKASEYREISEATSDALTAARLRLREVEQERDTMAKLAGEALVEMSLAPGETLKYPTDHALVAGANRLRLRAESAESRLAQAGKLAEAARALHTAAAEYMALSSPQHRDHLLGCMERWRTADTLESATKREG